MLLLVQSMLALKAVRLRRNYRTPPFGRIADRVDRVRSEPGFGDCLHSRPRCVRTSAARRRAVPTGQNPGFGHRASMGTSSSPWRICNPRLFGAQSPAGKPVVRVYRPSEIHLTDISRVGRTNPTCRPLGVFQADLSRRKRPAQKRPGVSVVVC